MSNAVSALQGTVYDGFTRIEEMGLRGMITLRGDLTSAKLKKAAVNTAGAEMPGQRQITYAGEAALAWMSPDELLALVPHGDVADRLTTLEDALKGEHALAVNVSDARAMFRVSGAGAREVIAKLAPVDLSPEAFAPGQIRRTRMAQVPAAIWMTEDGSAINVICFRSVAQYMFDILKASAETGSDVGYFA